MEKIDLQRHWENVYQTKSPEEMSWYQSSPSASLNFIQQFNVSKSAKIIDIGGGDSLLVDHLLDLGYTNITVLDISGGALERAKKRLGAKAEKVKWIIADINHFKPEEEYDFWHDRAAFHFLTTQGEISRYIALANQSIHPDGLLVIGTFSENGPSKCSGMEVAQYSEIGMSHMLQKFFKKVKCIIENHETPFQTIQNFIFCSFRKQIFNGL
jgi:trans-aconitate methyltransferase